MLVKKQENTDMFHFLKILWCTEKPHTCTEVTDDVCTPKARVDHTQFNCWFMRIHL